MIIKLVTLTRANRKADKSVSISFTTMQEQTTNEMAALDALFQQDCIIAIKPIETPFLDKELSDLDSIDLDLEDTSKTPSKRLRNVLWRLQEKELKRKPTDDEFKEFYKIRMEKLIELIKQKLD